MRLHLLVATASLLLAASAQAEDAPKPLESARPVNVRSGKTRSLFSPQAQLFIEQKDAPSIAKTAMRFDAQPRLSDKSKD